MRFATLMYHNLAEHPSSAYDITPGCFRDQLSWLLDAGFVVDDFDGLWSRLEGLSTDAGLELPERYVVLSFDDGHRSNLEAASILEAKGCRATFFCCKDVSRRPEFLGQSGLRELAALASVGSHAVTHQDLAKMPFEQARNELAESKSWLEDIAERKVSWFSAPYGAMNRRLHVEALDVGYRLIADSKEWWNTQHSAQGSRVSRIMISGAGTPSTQMERLQAAASLSSSYYVRRRTRFELARAVKRVLSEQQIGWIAATKRRLLG